MITVKLIRDNKTGDYYTEDKRFQVEKGSVGWNVYEFVPFYGCHSTFPCGWGRTLKEAKEVIIDIMSYQMEG